MKFTQWALVGPTVLLNSELISDEHGIAHVSCFTTKPHGCHKYLANIAKITFKKYSRGHTKVESSVRLKLTFLPPVSAKIAVDSDIQQNTLDPLSVSHLIISIQTTPQQNPFVQTALKNIMSSFKTVPSTNLN